MAIQRYAFTPTGAYARINLPTTDLQMPYPDVTTQGEIDATKLAANNQYLMDKLSENHRYLDRVDWGSGNGTRWRTIVIAAANSTSLSRSTADYVCPGAADEVLINQAITSLEGSGLSYIGRIVLLEGSYNLSAAINIDALSGRLLSIEGMGSAAGTNADLTTGGTLIIAAAGVAAFNLGGSSVVAGSAVIIENMQIRSSGSSGAIQSRDMGLTVRNCTIQYSGTSSAISQTNSTGQSGNTRIENNVISSSGAGSFGVNVANGGSNVCRVHGNFLYMSGSGCHGIVTTNAATVNPAYHITDNYMAGTRLSTGVGIRIGGTSTKANLVANNVIRDFTTGISIAGYGSVVQSNHILNCQTGIVDGFAECDSTLIEGNNILFDGYVGTVGIKVGSNGPCTFNSILANHIGGSNVGSCTNAIVIASGAVDTGVMLNDTYGSYTGAELTDAGTRTRRENSLTGVHSLIAGGTTGQALEKLSNTDYDVGWATVHEVPTGGSIRQVLAKISGTNYDYGWNSSGAPPGGTNGQVLQKNTVADYDYGWTTLAGAAGEEIKVDGTTIGTRATLNLKGGTSVTLSGVDTGTQIEVTINSSGGGGGGGSSSILNYNLFR